MKQVKSTLIFQNIPSDIFKCISFYLKINEIVALELSSKTHKKVTKTAISKHISENRWSCDSLTKLPIKLRKYVTILDCQNTSYDIIVFPNNLEQLIFSNKCDPSIFTSVFPETLTHLTIGDTFNQQVRVNVLPLTLTHLTFGWNFNKKISNGVLPSTLIHLIFGRNFNQTFDIGVLPCGLIELTFGFDFNQKFEKGVLPSNLTHLIFAPTYNKQIKKDVLPLSLTNLIIGESFEQIFTDGLGSLCLGITHLTIEWNFSRPIFKGFFSSSITHLNVTNCWSDNFEYKISKEDFPPNLTHLTLGDDFNHPISFGVLPSNLTHLSFNWNFNQPIEKGVLPSNLTHLSFGWKFNQPIEKGVLPTSLKYLKFGRRFNRPIGIGVLPTGLKYLNVGRDFNQPIGDCILPIGLKHFNLWDISNVFYNIDDDNIDDDTAYNFTNTGNNTFTWTNAFNVTALTTIPRGQYTIEQLLALINTAFTPNGSASLILNST